MAKTSEKNAPGWLNLKNIGMFLAMIGVGGGGYLAKDSKEVTVNDVNVKEVVQGIYENMALKEQNNKEVVINIQSRIDQTQDEMRENQSDLIENIKAMRKDIKEIKRCMEEKNLTNKKTINENLTVND